MEDFDLAAVSKKSVKGFVALTSRTFLVKLLGIVTSFVLTIFLDKQSYGVYFIASSIVVFLVYFQDIGLAASLIQKKEEPSSEEYRSTFTIQQILVLLMVVPGLFFSRQLANFYHLDKDGLYLLDGLLISFFLSSLKTIPTVMLERHLIFSKLVVPDIAENIVYNSILIILAMNHFGITSFTLAILARSIVGLFVIYYIQPWKIGLSFHFSTLKDLIRYGIPFQANSLLALVKDNLVNLYIGKVLMLDQVGTIGFAQKLSFLPSNLIMDNVIRVTFPAYSRLQHDKESLRIIVERSLFLVSASILPLVIGFSIFSSAFITYVPIQGYIKWLPAVVSITFFSLNILFASVTVPITNFLNAIGKVKITLYAMIWLTTFTWIITPLCIHIFGYNGVSLASFLVALSLIGILPFAKKYVSFSFVRPLSKPFISAVGMVVFSFFAKNLITSFLIFILVVVCSILVYLSILLSTSRRELKQAFAYISKV